MAEAELPFLYRKVVDLLKDETANPSRDYRITKKELKIVRGELASGGIIVLHKAGRKKYIRI